MLGQTLFRISRTVAVRSRSFSSSTLVQAAHDVKRLGVVGAGQMVHNLRVVLVAAQLMEFFIGSRNSISCFKGRSSPGDAG